MLKLLEMTDGKEDAGQGGKERGAEARSKAVWSEQPPDVRRLHQLEAGRELSASSVEPKHSTCAVGQKPC